MANDKAKKAYVKHVNKVRQLMTRNLMKEMRPYFVDEVCLALAKSVATYVAATLEAGNYQVFIDDKTYTITKPGYTQGQK